MRVLFLSIVVCFISLSCEKDEFVKPDYIVFGAFQGDCANGCRFVYYLDDTKLLEDETVKYFSNNNLSAFNTTLSNDEFELVKNLLNKVPLALTKTNRTLFIDLNSGSPNLWYAEIKLNGRVFKWTFDNSASATPSYLKPFADEVIEALLLLQ
jgi:hypothetical protein